MAINKKNKNRVVVGGKQYLWWMFDEFDQTEFDGIQVKVVSSDQTHFLKYGLQQVANERKVVLSLRDYAKLIHLSCPKFESKDGIITKSGIIRLIKWCRSKEHQIQYACDGKRNKLNAEQKTCLLKELQKMMS